MADRSPWVLGYLGAWESQALLLLLWWSVAFLTEAITFLWCFRHKMLALLLCHHQERTCLNSLWGRLPLLASGGGRKRGISLLRFLFEVQCDSPPCRMSPTMGPGTKCPLFFLFVLFCFFPRVSTTMCSLGCQSTSSVDQANFKLRKMHLPLSPSAGIKAMHHTGSNKCS